MKILQQRISELSKRKEYLSATSTQRATWIHLYSYCVQHDIRGVITSCMGRMDSDWLDLCGVTAKEVRQNCSLFRHAGNELFVWPYPEPDDPYRHNYAVVHTKNPTVRKRIFAKCGRKCSHCGATEDLCLDHIWPVTHGGTDEDDNLQVLCRSCNSKKSNKFPEVL